MKGLEADLESKEKIFVLKNRALAATSATAHLHRDGEMRQEQVETPAPAGT